MACAGCKKRKEAFHQRLKDAGGKPSFYHGKITAGKQGINVETLYNDNNDTIKEQHDTNKPNHTNLPTPDQKK